MDAKRRKIGLATTAAVTLALFFWLALGATTAVDATTVAVKVDPATQVVTAGSSFTVNVVVENVMDMSADQVVLNFEPSAMQATRIIEGEFLKSGGTTVPIETIDNTAGDSYIRLCANPE